MSCQQRDRRTTCIDDPHGLTPCTEMVKGFWASSSGAPTFPFQKERAESATRLQLTTATCESFKNFLNIRKISQTDASERLLRPKAAVKRAALQTLRAVR